MKRKSNTLQIPLETSEQPNDCEDNEAMDVDEPGPDNYYSDDEGGTRIGEIYIPPPVKPYCSAESKGPRLVITKIENENFKSYAGKITLGPFHHRFTAIIGPNGSGKSNVIDSMLFVFGYRAQKIRCKKLSTLLHNSASNPNCEKCTVGIHFKTVLDTPDGGYEEVAGSAFVIARTAFLDNASFYTINGRKVQFKEVSKQLKTHNVDLDHNRFLILQGEVESISMMKAKGQSQNECGMLEYLEDIVGTTRYKEPLEKIQQKVEILTEERREKHNRCKLAERDMKDLENPYNEAVKYLKEDNMLTFLKNIQIQKYLSEQNKALEKFAVEKEGIELEMKEHDIKNEELRTSRLEKEAKIKEEVTKFENMYKEKEKMDGNLVKSCNRFAEIQSTMKAANMRRKQNKTQLETLEEKLEELRKVPQKNQLEMKDCENKLEKLAKEKIQNEELLQTNYAELEKQTRPLNDERDKKETELIDLKKNVNDAKAEMDLAESELKILREEERVENRKLRTLETSWQEMNDELEEKQTISDELKKSIPEGKEEIRSKMLQIESFKAEEAQLSVKLRALKGEVTEKVNSMQQMRSNNKVLDSLMRQKIEGKIPGILGRLGDLGAIDSKYDVAISTACGRLDNIVVDTIDSAQACIEHLKRHDVGRASFIALEKVEHLRREFSKPLQIPENVPRLFDLVRVEDERVLPAFYFALGNTLVSNDLEQGTRIAYGAKRPRVVSLKGEVIESSGIMSGGGKTQMRGKIGQKVATKTGGSSNTSFISQKNVEVLQQQAQDMQSRINYLQEQQGSVERDIQKLKMVVQQKESQLSKLIVTITSHREQLPRVQSLMKTQKKRVAQTQVDPKKVQAVESKIAEKRDALEIAEKEAAKVTTKITVIKTKIESIHGDKIKSLKHRIDTITKQMTKLKMHISKLKVEVTTSENNVIKTQKSIQELRNDIKQAEDSITALNEERNQCDLECIEWKRKIEECQEEIAKARNESSGVQKEITAIQKMESDLKLERIDIETKLENIVMEIANVKSQLPHWQNKLKPLKYHQIPDEKEPKSLEIYGEEDLKTHTVESIQYQVTVQETTVDASKPNLSVIDEFINKRDVYMERVKVLEDITSKRNEMRSLFEDVRKKRYTEFMQGFQIITRKLKEMYQMITQGGDAELELVDSMDPFSEGVSFSVRPPKKTWKSISNLSGGEKTLSSLALVFALHYYKPSPLYFMDEIDAALDFKNISIVAHYIKERTKNAQFIIISLRSNMFELADYLVGIYKVMDCTNSVTVENNPPILMNSIQYADKSMDEVHLSPSLIDVGHQINGVLEEDSCEILPQPITQGIYDGRESR